MHKKFMILCASIGLCLLIPFSALALSESEYRELLKDYEFSAADKELKQAWDYAKNNLTPDEFDKLKESQREWVKNIRDESAEELIDFQGYSKVMAYIAVTNERIKVIREMSGQMTGKTSTAKIQTGIVKADKDYITVIAEGNAENKQKALEGAFIDAVRLAVGAIISARTELNNDELSENIIMHSRGVIEGFDVLDEKEEGGLTKIYIQAKVHREILQDETKRFMEAQTVKADTGAVIKAIQEQKKKQQNDEAKAKTIQAKQKSGAELLKELLDSYGPENFFSATLDPEIKFTKGKKPYIQVNEKFNQDVFWKEFIPKLHKALEGVAVKKVKYFYGDEVRRANIRFLKEGFFLRRGMVVRDDMSGITNLRTGSTTYRDGKTKEYVEVYLPYFAYIERNNTIYRVVVPHDNASYTIYDMPFGVRGNESNNLRDFYVKNFNVSNEKGVAVLIALMQFTQRMCRPVIYSVSYMNKSEEVMTIQIIRTGSRAFGVYRSFYDFHYISSAAGGDVHRINELYNDRIVFAPGFVNGDSNNPVYVINPQNEDYNKYNLFLGTSNYNKTHPEEGYEVELDSDELQRLDSMKFEVIFEQ